MDKGRSLAIENFALRWILAMNSCDEFLRWISLVFDRQKLANSLCYYFVLNNPSFVEKFSLSWHALDFAAKDLPHSASVLLYRRQAIWASWCPGSFWDRCLGRWIIVCQAPCRSTKIWCWTCHFQVMPLLPRQSPPQPISDWSCPITWSLVFWTSRSCSCPLLGTETSSKYSHLFLYLYFQHFYYLNWLSSPDD